MVGPSGAMAQRVHVHHNYFYNHQFKGANGGESIRLGLSGRQHAEPTALIENNLFEKADGDSEAISIKSSDNVVRYNTIPDSKGTSLRHGNTRVEGNILFGSARHPLLRQQPRGRQQLRRGHSGAGHGVRRRRGRQRADEQAARPSGPRHGRVQHGAG